MFRLFDQEELEIADFMLGSRSHFWATAAFLIWGAFVLGAEPAPAEVSHSAVFFDREVKPLLVTHCLKCHGGSGKPKGGLSLINRDGILKGGDSGPAVSLESPRESLLLEAVNYASVEMPPSGKLADEQIAVLRKWIDLGLPWGAHARSPRSQPTITAHLWWTKPRNHSGRFSQSFPPPCRRHLTTTG